MIAINFSLRFVASELVRSDKDDRLRSIISTDGVYFVKAKGLPSPDSVVLHLEYSDLYDTKVLRDNTAPVPGKFALHFFFSFPNSYLYSVFISTNYFSIYVI